MKNVSRAERANALLNYVVADAAKALGVGVPAVWEFIGVTEGSTLEERPAMRYAGQVAALVYQWRFQSASKKGGEAANSTIDAQVTPPGGGVA